MLQELGIKLASEAITREALIRELNECGEMIPLADGKVEYHSSLTVFSQELTSFLGFNNKQLLSDLCDWFDCRDPWKYRTKGCGTDEIHAVWLNLIGATTPASLQSALPPEAIGGGFTSRIIFIYEEDKGKLVPFPFPTETELRLYEKLTLDLQHIGLLRGQFCFTDEWIDKYNGWYAQQAQHPPQLGILFEHYIDRRSLHLRKLCSIMAAVRSDDMIITGKDFDRALQILTSTEIKMSKVFAGFGHNRDAAVLDRVMKTIASNKRITIAELHNLYHLDADRDTMARILGTLDAMKFCKIHHSAEGSYVEYISN
jgi:hypothetical protein